MTAGMTNAKKAVDEKRMQKPPLVVEVLPPVQNDDWETDLGSVWCGGGDNGLITLTANAPPRGGIPFVKLWM